MMFYSIKRGCKRVTCTMLFFNKETEEIRITITPLALPCALHDGHRPEVISLSVGEKLYPKTWVYY